MPKLASKRKLHSYYDKYPGDHRLAKAAYIATITEKIIVDASPGWTKIHPHSARPAIRNKMDKWLRRRLGDKFDRAAFSRFHIVSFDHAQDAVLFKLTWF